MENIGFTAIPAITTICYLIAQGIKATKVIDNKWLPIICGSAGAALGILARSIMPDYGANDPLTAVAIGIVSGLAATGANQVYKQLMGGDNSENY